MLSSNIFKFLLLQLFFVTYVFAQKSFVSTKAIYYKDETAYMCFSLTWLPFDVQELNCKKEINPFRGSKTGDKIKREAQDCNFEENKNNYSIGSIFENETLHQLSTLCASQCDDLEPEVNLDQVWQRIIAKNKTKEFCQMFSHLANPATDSRCPFSTRIDVQDYIYSTSSEKQNDSIPNNEDLCIDRFGRSYPPPKGLGGKCVMFQHEFLNDGKRVIEFFMPIEKRDLVQRIAKYPYTHEIRQNKTTLRRLLPDNSHIEFPEANCTTFQHIGEMFIHCVYHPNQSHLFYAPDPNFYACPKNEGFSRFNNESLMEEPFYTTRPISSDYLEFSDICYASITFIPVLPDTKAVAWNNKDTPFQMNISFIGKEKSACPTKYYVGKDSSEYTEKMNEAMEDLCPWDKNNSYTICFELQSKQILKNFYNLYQNLITTPFFDHCYYQSPRAKYGCYLIVDPVAKDTFRLPSKWVEKLEKNELIISPKVEWSKKESSSAFVYFTSELKEDCSKILNNTKESPIPGLSIDRVIKYFASNTKSFIVQCNETFCDAPFGYVPEAHNNNYWITQMKILYDKYPLNCFYGTRDNAIDTLTTKSASTFFCAVQLSIYHESGQKLRRYNFHHNLTVDYPVSPEDCWTSNEFAVKMKNSDVDATDVNSCDHDFSKHTVKCCCRASKEPCNVIDIADSYYEIADTDATEKQRRIHDGCRFDAKISTKTEETCAKDYVRNDREMRCYGIFKVPSPTDNNKNAKPTLIKENCYWPHPQYHDEYSVFCSKHFFDIDDLVDNKCLTLFINDFTSSSKSSTEKKFDRTLIICCNTGVYPDKRESILSRSVVVL